MVRALRFGLVLLLLTVPVGCYDNQPLKHAGIVMGTGIDKDEGEQGYTFSMEILRVGAGSGHAAGGTSLYGPRQSVVLRIQANDLFDAARNLIRFSKRRMFFTHNRVWIVSEKAARDNLVKIFDSVMRDQMLRMTSFLFVSKEAPEKVLTSSTLLEKLTSLELAAGVDALKYVGNFGQMYVMDFLEMMSGPVKAAYVPIIKIKEQSETTVTEISGIAIVKDDKMVGSLTQFETFGLILLRGEVVGGWLHTSDKELTNQISIEIQSQKTKITPRLENGSFAADIDIQLRGTLASVPPELDLKKPETIEKIERSAELWVKQVTVDTLRKLQKEYKADVINFGLQAYRKNPKAWKQIKDRWEEEFAEADISVNVNVDVYHMGLLNRSQGSIAEKPQHNPYRRFFKFH
jgi:spore germination protein KC